MMSTLNPMSKKNRSSALFIFVFLLRLSVSRVIVFFFSDAIVCNFLINVGTVLIIS